MTDTFRSRLNFICALPRSGGLALASKLSKYAIGLPHTHIIARTSRTKLNLYSSLNLYNVDDGLVRSIVKYIYNANDQHSIEAAYTLINSLTTCRDVLNLYSKFLPLSQSIYDPSFSIALYPELLENIAEAFPGSRIVLCIRDPLAFCYSCLTSIHGLDALIQWHSYYSSSDPSLPLDPLTMWTYMHKLIDRYSQQVSGILKIKRIYYRRRRFPFAPSIDHVCNLWHLLLTDPVRHTLLDRALDPAVYRIRNLLHSNHLFNAFSANLEWPDCISYAGDPSIYIKPVPHRGILKNYMTYLKSVGFTAISDAVDMLPNPGYAPFEDSLEILKRF